MNFFEKMKKMYFWQKREGAILHDENFDSTKSSLYARLNFVRKNGFRIYFQFCYILEKSATFWKNGKKFRKNYSLLYLLKKSRAKKVSTSRLA